MLRISILLLTLSMLQMTVSVSLLAQYSHFPLTHLQVDRVEFEKFTETFPIYAVSDMAPDIVKFPSTNPQLTTPTSTKFFIENGASFRDYPSSQPSNVDLGISQDLIAQSDLNLKYIDNLPATPRIDFPGSPTFFDDFFYFLKDLFDNENNYSEANLSHNLPYFNYNSSTHDKFSQLREAGIENLSISSFLSSSSISLPIEHPITEKSSLPYRTVSHEEIISSPHSPNRHTHSKAQNNSDHIFDSQAPTTVYDIFETNSLVVQSESFRSQRDRRGRADPIWNAEDVATWEINVFDGSSGSNEGLIQFVNDFDVNDTNSTDFNLNIVAPDGVGNLAVFAYGHIGGGAWTDFLGTSGFKFMSLAGRTVNLNDTNGSVTSYFNLNTDGIDAWLNPNGTSHNSFVWGVYNYGSDYYLTYNSTTDLTLSQAPEPSTYVMTGALLCFIGFNQKSRKAFKEISQKVHRKFKLQTFTKKLNTSQIQS